MKPEELLPLQPAVFHILLALADRDRHGYAILQDIAARTGGRIRMSPGTLYGSIKRMLDQGLIEEFEDLNTSDERRRYYRISRFGRRVAIAEAARFESLLAQGRATGLLPS
jgi:DNA-binding PadR family transcriptional regulator